MNRFEIYYSFGSYRWRLRAANGEIVASGEPYATKFSAYSAANKIRQWANGAVIIEL